MRGVKYQHGERKCDLCDVEANHAKDSIMIIFDPKKALGEQITRVHTACAMEKMFTPREVPCQT